jgi:hypothetical protein
MPLGTVVVVVEDVVVVVVVVVGGAEPDLYVAVTVTSTLGI